METQNIANLLEDSDYDDDDDVLRFATRKWCTINDQNNRQYGKGMKMIQLLNLIQKLLNQIFVTTQMHIFL